MRSGIFVQIAVMKEVVIIVPNGNVTLSCITGAYQILRSADAYWQKLGKKPMMNIAIAGFMPEQKLDGGYFSVHPMNIADISSIDLLVIPATPYHPELFRDNTALIDRIRDEYKNGAEIACMCSGAFLLAATGLLEGRRCSIHWNVADKFKRLFPEIEVVVDKNAKTVYTSYNGFTPGLRFGASVGIRF
jgi:transcriptional regulator GlxA family with amidase domain